MAREHESLFPVLEELNIGFVAFSPLANGILTDAFKAGDTFTADDYRSIMPQYSEESFEKNRDLFVLIRDLAREKAATPAQISLAWMLGKKPYIIPIPGSRKHVRIKENLGAAENLWGDIVLCGEGVCFVGKVIYEGVELFHELEAGVAHCHNALHLELGV